MVYIPSQLQGLKQGEDADKVGKYAQRELMAIAREFAGPYDMLPLRPLSVAPGTTGGLPKPRQGWLVYADGTNWNPGSGEGLYRYTGSAWVFVG